MVWDKLQDKLSDYDWQVLGYDVSNGCLPRKRFDLPLPYYADGLNSLADRLFSLAEQLHSTARQPVSGRLKVLDASNLIHQAHLNMKALRQEWERELRGEAKPKAIAPPLSSSGED